MARLVTARPIIVVGVRRDLHAGGRDHSAAGDDDLRRVCSGCGSLPQQHASLDQRIHGAASAG